MHTLVITVLCILFASTTSLPAPASEDLSVSRIVNGYAVDIAQVPYQAALRRRTASGWNHLCGAAVIGPNVVLTAAHCVNIYQIEPSVLRAVVGTSYRLSNGKAYEIKRIVSHESYSSSTLQNDIALVVTQNKMSYSSSVQSIPIAGKNYVLANGTEAIVSGFGVVSYEGTASPILLAAKVNIVAQATCSRAYLGIATITDGMICASANNPPRDACQGDSGGPLAANNVLIGIVSWGEKCADQAYPGVYTRVSEYETWILSRVNQYG